MFDREPLNPGLHCIAFTSNSLLMAPGVIVIRYENSTAKPSKVATHQARTVTIVSRRSSTEQAVKEGSMTFQAMYRNTEARFKTNLVMYVLSEPCRSSQTTVFARSTTSPRVVFSNIEYELDC